MKLHREGTKIILTTLILVAIGTFLNFYFLYDNMPLITYILTFMLFLFVLLIIQFFRIPTRKRSLGQNEIMCPADGKIVAIEETEENEFFKDRRIQVSIFMSPLNVHANFYPISGRISYQKYHPGKFLVAWHPKSSEENERSSMVIEDDHGNQLLIRQIAGALARRICYYGEFGSVVKQGSELGFIKFGSRVDLFLPLNTKIDVQIGDKVKAIDTKIGIIN